MFAIYTYTSLVRQIRRMNTTFGLDRWAILFGAAFATGQVPMRVSYIAGVLASKYNTSRSLPWKVYRLLAEELVVILVAVGSMIL